MPSIIQSFPVTRMHEPILVTGAQRSGTTWVGRMLGASERIAYINEPLNPLTPAVLIPLPVSNQYVYICRENEERFLAPLQRLLSFRYPTREEIGAISSPSDILRMGRRWGYFSLAKAKDKRPLLKDPFAVFSAPWFSRRLGCRVVITVRHPIALVSSFVRLGWRVQFEPLLEQHLLLRDLLGSFQIEMERMVHAREDIVGQACLLWNMVYSVSHKYLNEFPEFVLVRHEDLSQNTIAGYKRLYASLGVEFSKRTEAKIRDASNDANPLEVAVNRPHRVRIDSRANLENWRHRLDSRDIVRIQELTEAVATRFYDQSS